VAGGLGVAVALAAALEVYVPFTTVVDRFGLTSSLSRAGSTESTHVELHQIVRTIEDEDAVLDAARAIRTVFDRRHDRRDGARRGAAARVGRAVWRSSRHAPPAHRASSRVRRRRRVPASARRGTVRRRRRAVPRRVAGAPAPRPG